MSIKWEIFLVFDKFCQRYSLGLISKKQTKKIISSYLLYVWLKIWQNNYQISILGGTFSSPFGYITGNSYDDRLTLFFENRIETRQLKAVYRYNAASTIYNDYIIIHGGDELGSYSSESLEYHSIYDDSSSDILYFHLPYPINNHCLVTYQNETWAIGGKVLLDGWFNKLFPKYYEEVSYRTFHANCIDCIYQKGPELYSARYAHTCGVINIPDEAIVVAGGFNEYDIALDTVEIYSNGAWSRGKIYTFSKRLAFR